MWTLNQEQIAPVTTRIGIEYGAVRLSFREMVDLWCENAEFRTFFNATIAAQPFEACFWESVPVTAQTLGAPYECVVIDAPSLARLPPDPDAFRSHFDVAPASEVLAFPNLGGDAMLVVPAPRADVDCYTHIGRFVRTAPAAQVDMFWRTIGQALRERISSAPLWLSTSGLGIAWLHVRLDSRPKYYQHKDYTRRR